MGSKNRNAVRIIAGEFKGRRLSYPARKETRPTMERTRGSLFDSLGARVEGCVFADLFAAAGGVGIEAASRGAALVHFVENDPTALECLRRNLETCRVPPEKYRIHRTDVIRFLGAGRLAGTGVRIVFADPPYGSDLARTVLAHFDENDYDFLEALILEHSGGLDDAPLRRLRVEKSKRFGETFLTFVAFPGAEQD